MKNKIQDLNNHLFAALERLNDEDLTIDQIETEIERSRAVSAVAVQIISVGNLVLKAEEMKREGLVGKDNMVLIGG